MTVLKLLIMETVLFRVYDVTNIDDDIDAHNNDSDKSGNNYDNIRLIIYDDRNSGDIDDDANIDKIYADNRDVDIHDSDIDHRSIEIITELLLQRNSTRIHTT